MGEAHRKHRPKRSAYKIIVWNSERKGAYRSLNLGGDSVFFRNVHEILPDCTYSRPEGSNSFQNLSSNQNIVKCCLVT
jgi:hypothetical protein